KYAKRVGSISKFNYATKPFASLIKSYPALSAELESRNVIILPSQGNDDEFYNGSLDTLDYLNNNSDVIEADIYSTDDNYKEIGLHAAEIWLGTIIIQYVVAPIFCSLIAAYIYDELKSKDDDDISLKFIVEKKDGSTKSVSYDGKVQNLQKAIDAVKEISDER
ncbi:hypothetical protein AB6C56_21460, partial [Vibrio splendidus]